jgi:hypothetical protein
MKAYWGNSGIVPLILDLGTRWRWVVSLTPRPLYPQGKSPRYPLERRLGVPYSRSGRGGEEKNSQPLPELEPPIIQPAAQRYTAELSRLLVNPCGIWKFLKHLRWIWSPVTLPVTPFAWTAFLWGSFGIRQHVVLPIARPCAVERTGGTVRRRAVTTTYGVSQ